MFLGCLKANGQSRKSLVLKKEKDLEDSVMRFNKTPVTRASDKDGHSISVRHTDCPSDNSF